MRNEDIPKELEEQAILICKIQKIDILWLKGPFLATAVNCTIDFIYKTNYLACDRLKSVTQLL